MKVKTLLGMTMVFFALATMGGNSYADTKTRSVFNGKARMELPAEYQKMPDNKLKEAYSSSGRPKEAWYMTDRNTGAMVTFSQFEMKGKKMAESNLRAVAEGMVEEFGSSPPTMREGKVNGRKVIWLELQKMSIKSSGKRASMMQLSEYRGSLLVTTLIVDNDKGDRHYSAGKRALKTLSY
ncbi:hypothetical protein I2494_02495 [Budviciaceae bacterium BWR-B9]|uniref:Uncharacterized protein n=2 Tax=Limnobaculum TaxID=2172100 RepID=A0A411WKD6_9GAMM|nr:MULTISPECIES: hypothetical protein [Limnobaculum]MBK5142603.1 hypothetical protein [Limnobaculum allomyrinae]MBV7690512.1 hypothetical protein [Limnobaculum sp. M2-1]QBH96617.1 hypothetical protein EKN56_09480 [Limnobaculum zhutongyuii]TQS90352.1 hypothetical protein ELQ32_03105 [Limnobaculum zhutongyuii]